LRLPVSGSSPPPSDGTNARNIGGSGRIPELANRCQRSA
jgi:hypothetical protein